MRAFLFYVEGRGMADIGRNHWPIVKLLINFVF